MATLKEIAEKTGVSISTVSRILNSDQSLSVSPETREKVLAVAEHLKYKTINQRYGREKKTKPKVGIAQMFEMNQLIEDPYYLLLKNAVEEFCFEAGIETTVLFRVSEEFTCSKDIMLDGIFAIGRFNNTEIKSLESKTSNIVFIDSSPNDEIYSSVIPNYKLGVTLAIKHLIKSGHEKIGFIGERLTLGNGKEKTLDSRIIHFESQLNELNLLNKDYIIDCEMNSQSGYKHIIKFLEEQKDIPTAFFISSDAIAPGVMRAFNEMNIRVPEDISVIAFNDTILSEYTIPPLTSVAVYINQIVKTAIKLMEELLCDNKFPTKAIIPCKLIIRNSTKL